MDAYATAITGAMMAAGLTQAEVARRLEVTDQAVAYWRTGRRRPTPALAARLERVLGVPARLAYPELWGEAREPAA